MARRVRRAATRRVSRRRARRAVTRRASRRRLAVASFRDLY